MGGQPNSISSPPVREQSGIWAPLPAGAGWSLPIPITWEPFLQDMAHSLPACCFSQEQKLAKIYHSTKPRIEHI